jgi:hypothetical protein
METLQRLSAKLPVEAIQRTKKAETKRGYDTDGYGYQYVVDRFNDVLGDGWGFTYHVIRETEGQYKSGMPYYDITVEVSIWVGDKDKPRACVGGHIAVLYSDALKGAITNGFKKAAAFWGVGRDAYAGTLDDDNAPLPDETANIDHAARKTVKQEAMEKIAALPDHIKEGFRIIGYTSKAVYEMCVKCGWDNEKISSEISRLADQGAA